jgi:hypothetical protein
VIVRTPSSPAATHDDGRTQKDDETSCGGGGAAPGSFFPGEPPVSTVVGVSGLMPSADVLVEVEATAYLPRK